MFSRSAASRCILPVIAIALVACSVDGLAPRPSIDIATRTSAVPAPVAVAAAPAPAAPVAQSLAPAPVPAPVNPAPVVRQAGFSPGFIVPRREEAPGVMPADEIACRTQLRRLGVAYQDIPEVGNGSSCGIKWPVKVSGLSSGVQVTPAATLTCSMALALARWNKEELVPAARLRYLSGVARIRNGSSYSCRRIRGSGRWSAHSSGNAIDLMDITLKNGKTIDIRKPGFFAFRQKGLLSSVREDACPYFKTVLGPGYDADHKDHFHFDLMERRSGRSVCK